MLNVILGISIGQHYEIVVRLSVASFIVMQCYCAECRFAKCHQAECRFAKCQQAECNYAECCHAECHHAECRHAECRHAECDSWHESVVRLSVAFFIVMQCYYAECRLAKCQQAERHYAVCHGALATLYTSLQARRQRDSQHNGIQHIDTQNNNEKTQNSE